MASFRFLALASLLLGGAAAQADSNERQKVWAAVVYINHGETTPQFGPLENILTPEGAQQMFRQGTAFRNRYLSVDSKNPGPDAAPIQNMSQSAINNAQITAMSQTDEYLVGGATAFFQGLYPASNVAYNRDAGGMDLARNLVSGDNLTDFPLGGYQYARIQSVTRFDPDYLAIQGSAGCLAWEAETAKLFSQDDMVQSYRGSYQFYQDLFTSAPLQGLVDPTAADFWNAYQLYELVKYMYSHNNTVFRQLDNANDTLAFLEAHALELDTAMTSSQPGDNDQMSDLAITIAGRTMADKIEYQLTMNAQSQGELNKLTVLFGTWLPMMSFFDIAALKTNDTSADSPFSQLPNPGAAMVFELIGNNGDDLNEMPEIEDLRVRFLYRASADEDAEFTAVGLFGSSGAEQGIPWTDFSRLMRSVGVSPSAWCSICQPTDASWCDGSDGTSHSGGFTGGDSSDEKSELSPVVAGVIGAVVTLAVTALLGLALFLICGFRLRRAEKNSDNTTVGGFKGAERMPDDKDVAVTKGGAQHERVGSWELRDGAGTPPAFNGAGIVTSDFHRRDEVMGAEDDGISVTGARVVNTRESV